MPSRDPRNAVAARYNLADDPCLVFLAPRAPPTPTGEHLQPMDRLRDSTMLCDHSKPNGQNQTADSQITASAERCAQNDAYGTTPIAAEKACPLEPFTLTVE